MTGFLVFLAVWLVGGLLIGIPMGKASIRIYDAANSNKPHSRFWAAVLFPLNFMENDIWRRTEAMTWFKDDRRATWKQKYVALQVFIWPFRCFIWIALMWFVIVLQKIWDGCLSFMGSLVKVGSEPKAAPAGAELTGPSKNIKVTVRRYEAKQYSYFVELESEGDSKVYLMVKFPGDPVTQPEDQSLRKYLCGTFVSRSVNDQSVELPIEPGQYIKLRRALWNLLKNFEQETAPDSESASTEAEYASRHMIYRVLVGNLPEPEPAAK